MSPRAHHHRRGASSAIAPDLAVEVLSPSDRMKRVLDKVGEYRFIASDGELGGEDVLPGFRCRLSDLLD